MTLLILFFGSAVCSLWLCVTERAEAGRAYLIARDKGGGKARLKIAAKERRFATASVLISAIVLAIAIISIVNPIKPVRPNPYVVANRLLFIALPVVLLVKALMNRSGRSSVSDAVMHTDEFEDEIREPYLTALWGAASIVVVDADSGVILHASTHADALFGYPDGTMVGMRVERLVPEASMRAHVKARELYAMAPHARYSHGTKFRGRRMDGTEVPLAIQLVPVLGNSRILVLLADATPMPEEA